MNTPILIVLLILSFIGILLALRRCAHLKRELDAERENTQRLVNTQRLLEEERERTQQELQIVRLEASRDVDALVAIIQRLGRDSALGKGAETALNKIGYFLDYQEEKGHWDEQSVCVGFIDTGPAANSVTYGKEELYETQRVWIVDLPRHVVATSKPSA